MKRIKLFLLLLVPLLAFATNYQVDTEAELAEALGKAKAGDVVDIAPGDYIASRIYAIRQNGTADKPILIKGAGIRSTVIYGKNGKCIRLYGNHIILENLTLTGGGDPLEIAGQYNTVRYVSCEESNIGIKISGDHNTIHDCFIFSNEKEGIEVNGGFIYVPEWGDYAIRIREAIGQVPSYSDEKNAANRAKWNAEQLAFFENLWGNRDMDLIIKRVFLHDNAYNRYPEQGFPDGWKYGQALYGGAIKLVPNVAGVTIDSCFVYKNGFSAYWWDEPSAGTNIVQNSIAIDAHHGVHVEIGLDPPNHRAIIKNNVFWNVHQGVFNSASGTNIYEGNLINSFQYGIVNHGIKGSRTERKTIATFKNNKVFMEPFIRNRVGDYKYEKPLGHMVWFSGSNSIGSVREGNIFVLTDSFPELRISNTESEGYSFAPSNLGGLIGGESTEFINEVPQLSLDAWPLQLPLFTEYFDRTDVSFDGLVIDPPDSGGGGPGDTTIVDTTNTNPPNIPDNDNPDIVVTSDFSLDSDLDDIDAAAFLASLLDKYNLKLFIAGVSKRKVEGSQAFFDNHFHPAYKAAQPALDALYGNFPEEFPFLVSDLNGVGYQDKDVLPASTKALYDLIPSEYGRILYIFWWGHASEVAQLCRYLEYHDPGKFDNIVIIAHAATLDSHNNYRGDKTGSDYVESLAKAGKVKLYHFGFAGKVIDGRHSYPLVKINSHGTALGELTKYKHSKVGGPQTDASDFSTVGFSVIDSPDPPFRGGLDYLSELESGVVNSNESKIKADFKDFRPEFFPFMSDRYEKVANWDGTTTGGGGGNDGNNGNTGNSSLKTLLLELLLQVDNAEDAIIELKNSLKDLIDQQ